MTKISTLYLCPRCESAINSVYDLLSCPECALPLGKQPQAPYTPPYTITEQHEKYKDKELRVKTLVNLPIAKANSMMNDALSIIEVVSGKNTATPDIRDLIGMAIRIGEIAKAYSSYLEAGGRHVPTFFITTSTASGVTDESKSTSSSKQTSSST